MSSSGARGGWDKEINVMESRTRQEAHAATVNADPTSQDARRPATFPTVRHHASNVASGNAPTPGVTAVEAAAPAPRSVPELSPVPPTDAEDDAAWGEVNHGSLARKIDFPQFNNDNVWPLTPPEYSTAEAILPVPPSKVIPSPAPPPTVRPGQQTKPAVAEPTAASTTARSSVSGENEGSEKSVGVPATFLEQPEPPPPAADSLAPKPPSLSSLPAPPKGPRQRTASVPKPDSGQPTVAKGDPVTAIVLQSSQNSGRDKSLPVPADVVQGMGTGSAASLVAETASGIPGGSLGTVALAGPPLHAATIPSAAAAKQLGSSADVDNVSQLSNPPATASVKDGDPRPTERRKVSGTLAGSSSGSSPKISEIPQPVSLGPNDGLTVPAEISINAESHTPSLHVRSTALPNLKTVRKLTPSELLREQDEKLRLERAEKEKTAKERFDAKVSAIVELNQQRARAREARKIAGENEDRSEDAISDTSSELEAESAKNGAALDGVRNGQSIQASGHTPMSSKRRADPRTQEGRADIKRKRPDDSTAAPARPPGKTRLLAASSEGEKRARRGPNPNPTGASPPVARVAGVIRRP